MYYVYDQYHVIRTKDDLTAFSTSDGHKMLFAPVDMHINVPSG